MRLIVMACSGRKRPQAAPMPALLRYDGVAYRTLWRYLSPRTAAPAMALTHDAQHQAAHIRSVQEWCSLDVLILSAEHGLLQSDALLAPYDRRMTRARALELRAAASQRLTAWLAERQYDATLIMLGADYRPALPHALFGIEHRTALGSVMTTAGGIGTQLGQLARWLRDTTTPDIPTDPPRCYVCEQLGQPGSFILDPEGDPVFFCAACNQAEIDHFAAHYERREDGDDLPF